MQDDTHRSAVVPFTHVSPIGARGPCSTGIGSDGRQPQRPGNRHFSRRLAVLTADAAWHFDQAQVSREQQFLKLVVFFSTPIVGGEPVLSRSAATE
jgi:hypothetical protein